MASGFPTDDYLWAESAPTNGAVDPTNKRTQGYVFGDDLPFNEFNWLMRSFGRHIDHLTRSAARFDTLKEADDHVVANESFILQRTGSAPQVAGQTLGATVAATARAVADMDCDGVYIFRLEQGDGASNNARIRIETIHGSDVETVIDVGSLSTGMQAIATNGEYVACAEGTSTTHQVRVFDVATGTQQFSFDHGSGISDLFMDDKYLYAVGADDATNQAIEVWNLSTQTRAWTYSHGAALNAVYSDGEHVFVGGNAGTGGHHIRKFQRDSNTVVGQVTDNAVSDKNCLVVSQNNIYALTFPTSTPTLARYSKSGTPGSPDTLTKIEQLQYTSTSNRGLAIDSRNVYVGLDDGVITMQTDAYMQSSYQGWRDDDFGNRVIRAVCTDGRDCIFIDEQTTLGGTVRCYTGYNIGTWLKLDVGAQGWQQRRLVTQ